MITRIIDIFIIMLSCGIILFFNHTITPNHIQSEEYGYNRVIIAKSNEYYMCCYGCGCDGDKRNTLVTIAGIRPTQYYFCKNCLYMIVTYLQIHEDKTSLMYQLFGSIDTLSYDTKLYLCNPRECYDVISPESQCKHAVIAELFRNWSNSDIARVILDIYYIILCDAFKKLSVNYTPAAPTQFNQRR